MADTHVTRALHAEHLATLALLERTEALLGHNGPAAPPDLGQPGTAGLLRDLVTAVTAELAPHFAFEERALFPLLGDSELTDLLISEHATLLAVAEALAAQARAALADGFSRPGWARFHAAAAALAGPLAAHVEKEELGLLPQLDAALDADTDAGLAMDYAINR